MKIPYNPEPLNDWAIRYKVYGGWIVESFTGSSPSDPQNTFKTAVFVPDEMHKWEL